MKVRLAIVLLAALAVAASCSLSARVPKRYALVVGISIYNDLWPEGQSLNLSWCDDDAYAIESMLLAEGFDQVDTLVNAAVTKTDIQGGVDAIATLMEPGDLFLFYYSGHGVQVTANDASWPPEARGHEWIFPKDAVVVTGAGEWQYDFDFANAIADTELAGILASVPSARKVVVLDACNSGGFIADGLEVDTTPPDLWDDRPPLPWDILAAAIRKYAEYAAGGGSGLSAGDALVLSASGAAESSWESGGHGVATYYLLQTPQYGDLNRDGYVTTLEAFAWVTAGISRNWNVPPGSWVYLPHLSGGPVDYALFTSP